ncbi:MAG: DUF1257 domain-containing protein [Lentisphaeria bacterium]|nr:DUF1257 domain-containing protein [Lentisphaeria bacterium]
MSAIVILPIVLPAVGSVVWPVFAAAAATAASSLGFVGAGASRTTVAAANEVTLEGVHCTEISDTVGTGDAAVFRKDDVVLTVARDASGQLTVKAASEERSKEELEGIGREMIGRLMQQYAYHRIVSELKSRNFNLVEEEVEKDGTVRLQVRVYQGD